MIYTITLNPSIDYFVTLTEFTVGGLNRAESERIVVAGKGVNVSDALAELSRLNGVEQIHIEPYHPLGISKARQLGKVQMYSNETFLQRDLLQPYVDRLRKNSLIEVIVL